MRSTSYPQSSDRGHPIFRALIVVLGVLIGLPAGFTYFVLSKSLRNQNVCHIGPVRVNPNAAVRDVENWWDHREKLLQLYGTYTTFDDASYYFAKTPYDIQPLCLPAFGWWSITTLSLTLLNPKIRQARQLHFRRTGDSYHVRTSPAIQWDQSHRIKDAPKFSSNQHSSTNNRWCAVNTQDIGQYQQDDTSRNDRQEELSKSVFGEKAVQLIKSTQATPKELFRVCAPSQASILSNGDQAPYFVELPLQPPEDGRWQRYEVNTKDDGKKGVKDYENYDDDGGDDSIRTKYKLRSRPSSPYQLQVQCHVRDTDLKHLAHGTLQPNSEPHLGWEHAEFIESPLWHPVELPGTMLVLLGLLLGKLRPNENCTERHLIRRWQQGWTHPTWSSFCWTLVWVYLMGACLEPLLGSMTLLVLHASLLLWVSLWGCTVYYLWVVFGFTIMLAQLEPELHIGPIQIFAISFGESSNALKINLLSVLVGLYPIISASSTKVDWKTALGVTFMGWALTNVLCQEILAAPQWTLPTILMGDLWWNLQLLSKANYVKKTDTELEPILEEDEEIEENDEDENDTMSGDSTMFSFVSEAEATIFPKIIRLGTVVAVYAFFVFWFAMTLVCCMTFDWTLVISHVMVLWMYIGSITFPKHRLWSLYHMVAATWLIVFNIMTLVGWSFCHVAITTHALHALPPKYVWASLSLQTALHVLALLHTICTKNWSTSPNVPFHYFWDQIKIIGDEIKMWYYIFS